jgi:hypothetical protein
MISILEHLANRRIIRRNLAAGRKPMAKGPALEPTWIDTWLARLAICALVYLWLTEFGMIKDMFQ